MMINIHIYIYIYIYHLVKDSSCVLCLHSYGFFLLLHFFKRINSLDMRRK